MTATIDSSTTTVEFALESAAESAGWDVIPNDEGLSLFQATSNGRWEVFVSYPDLQDSALREKEFAAVRRVNGNATDATNRIETLLDWLIKDVIKYKCEFAANNGL